MFLLFLVLIGVACELLQKDHQAIDILLAEIDIYELFAFKHCEGRKVKLALCEGRSIFLKDCILGRCLCFSIDLYVSER